MPSDREHRRRALLYWEVDGGGSVARASRPSAHPDLALPQHMTPQLAPPGWRPIFVGYLYLGFTNALAFSPTDVMPLVTWAKSEPRGSRAGEIDGERDSCFRRRSRGQHAAD